MVSVSGSSSHALVCINGDCDDSTLARASFYPDTIIVAVDGGLRHTRTLERAPDFLIGDLDSVDQDHLESVASEHTRILRHHKEKDATDLELALQHLVDLSISAVTLVGVAGGRLDHSLANLLLLGNRDWPFSIEFFGADTYGYLITSDNPFDRALPVQSTVSLLPLSDPVTGVTTRGLYYPLDVAVLTLGSTLGISNVVTETQVKVTVIGGRLLLVVNDAP